MYQFRRLSQNQLCSSFLYTVIVILVISLITILVLLLWYLLASMHSGHRQNTCPPNPCVSTTLTNVNTTQTYTISSTSSTSFSSASILSTESVTSKKRTYKETCDHLFDCYIESGLLCVYGWNEMKQCLCEGSHYWSVQRNKCLRKGGMNDSCNLDYECHREIGFVCEKLPNVATKTCICAADIYWAKDSNCGHTMIQHIVDCIDETYATNCLVLGMNGIYHMVTIRSLTTKELAFDWFLIDNRMLSDLPQLSCAFNNETRYCFGLSTQDTEHSLKLAQFTRTGFHGIENLAGANIGTAFGLADKDSVSVYVRDDQNVLYRRYIIDDELSSVYYIAPSVTGDPTCYIQQVSSTRQLFCFARNQIHGLSEYAELSLNTWRVTPLGYETDRILSAAAPVCSYVGSVHRYCFDIFENEQIYRILYTTNGWSTWQMIGNGQQQFLNPPVFFTSKLQNASDADQTCYLIAIDRNSQLQLSMNSNCAAFDNFSFWIPIESNRKFKQFDKVFRLRDGTIGVLGIDEQNLAYYIYLDLDTRSFTLSQPALTVKPVQFRP
ncbi:unnamed protein product [Adineta ricciae]|uniref:Uncharacterized protein n=1 Tax=Adineta ricciae TaxID=249248 RepID=A0A814GU95_ADIRI|nr:unnamed protein product [Adineta ricciae]